MAKPGHGATGECGAAAVARAGAREGILLPDLLAQPVAEALKLIVSSFPFRNRRRVGFISWQLFFLRIFTSNKLINEKLRLRLVVSAHLSETAVKKLLPAHFPFSYAAALSMGQ